MVRHQNPENILRLWQRTHQKLSDEMQDKFLARKELDDICRYSVTSVKEAVEKHKKLNDILSELRQTEVIVVKELPEPISPRPNFPNPTIRAKTTAFKGGSYAPTTETCSQCGGIINVATAASHECHF